MACLPLRLMIPTINFLEERLRSMIVQRMIVMSIETTYRRVTQDVFEKFIANPELAYAQWYAVGFPPDSTVAGARFQGEGDGNRTFSLGKEWHALHYLLTDESDLKKASQAPPPLGNVVLGGT